MNGQTRFLPGLVCGLSICLTPIVGATVFSLTGWREPEVIKIDENSLQVLEGTIQSRGGGRNQIAVDENGRLFAISNDELLEFDPVSLEILNRAWQPDFGYGLAAQNGWLYTLAGFENPG